MTLARLMKRLPGGNTGAVQPTDPIACDVSQATATPTNGTTGKIADLLASLAAGFGVGGGTTKQPFTAGQSDTSVPSVDYARRIGRPSLYNLDPANVTSWRVWLGYMRTGQGTPRIAILGDSTTFGFQSISPATAMRYNGWPNKLAPLMTQKGLFPAQSENFFCEWPSDSCGAMRRGFRSSHFV